MQIFGAQVEVASLPATGNVAKLMTLQMNQVCNPAALTARPRHLCPD